MVRITGGVLKGRRLAVPPGIRPTTELARKAAFDILGDAVNRARVLDAAAGSGAYGMEALSRGAAHATFVESDKAVLEILEKNVALVESRASVVRASVSAFIPIHLLSRSLFGLIFHDPPYEAASEADLSGLLSLLAPDGWLFHERGDDRQLLPGGRAPDDMRRYGATRFLIFHGRGAASA